MCGEAPAKPEVTGEASVSSPRVICHGGATWPAEPDCAECGMPEAPTCNGDSRPMRGTGEPEDDSRPMRGTEEPTEEPEDVDAGALLVRVRAKRNPRSLSSVLT